MRIPVCALALTALVAFHATGAEETTVSEKEVMTSTETRQTTTTKAVEKKTPQLSAKGADIQTDLRSDPLFEPAQIDVDLYKGLVIVHGSTANRDTLLAVNEKLRGREGVVAVY